MLLSATTAGKHPKDQFDFFPLTIDVEERMYAVGQIPGSFFRSEGRPGEDAILTCRLIDRPLRPTFKKGLRNEVQVVITVLALDPDQPYDVLAINAASMSTQLSGLPFSGPVGGALPRSACAGAARGSSISPAYSPQARGRSERAFRTLQDRLPKGFALAGIADLTAANCFIAGTFLPAYNERFAIAAAEPGTAFVAVACAQWQDVLCVQEERVVGNDNTIAFQRLRLQIPKSRLRVDFVKAKVRVHQYCDGTHAIFHGPQCLARYQADGSLIEETVNGPLKTARAPACGYVDNASALPTSPQAHQQQQ